MRANRASYSPEGWRQHVLDLNRAKRLRLKERLELGWSIEKALTTKVAKGKA